MLPNQPHSKPLLPNDWSLIESDIIYQTTEGQQVSFGQDQIKLGMKYDKDGKHLKAIEKGRVPPKGNNGLVPSQEQNYALKTKVLGKGGDYRFHGKFLDKNLYFPGKMTEH